MSCSECYPAGGTHHYHEIRPDDEAIDRLFLDFLLGAYREGPAEIVLDLNVADVPLHGHQEVGFFHSY